MLDRVLRRWHLKLLALGLAFAVWVAVTGEGRAVQDFRVPVEVLLGEPTTLAGSPPLQVDVRLRGPESVLRRIDPYDLDVRVDLRDATAGERTVPLTPRFVSGVPRDVEVVHIEPDRLRLNLARKLRREIPVVPTLFGRPPRGYAVYRTAPRPEGLLVEGPEAKLGAVGRVKTDPIRLDDRRETFVVRVAAVSEAADVKIVDTRPLDVTVYIDLAPVEATIGRVPVVLAGDGSRTVVVPSTVAVTLSAPSAMIPTLRAGHLRAVVDLAAVPAGTELRAVAPRIEVTGLDADAKARVIVKSVQPRTVIVRRPR